MPWMRVSKVDWPGVRLLCQQASGQRDWVLQSFGPVVEVAEAVEAAFAAASVAVADVAAVAAVVAVVVHCS